MFKDTTIRNYLWTGLSLSYLALLLVGVIFWGLNIYLFITFAALAIVFLIKDPDLALTAIILLTIVFERFFTLSILTLNLQEIYKLYPLDILIGVLVIGWLLQIRSHPKHQLSWGWPEWLLTGFMLVMTANFIRSLFDINADLSLAFSAFKNYTFYPILYFLTSYLVQTKQQLKKYVHVFLLGGLILIGFIITGLLLGQGLWTEYTPLSTEGVRYLASTHAFYLVLALILTLSLVIYDRFNNPKFINLIMWLWLIGVIGSLMRHLWLGLAVGAASLLVFSHQKNKLELGKFFAVNAFIAVTVLTVIIFLVSLFQLNQNGLVNKIQAGYQQTVTRASSIASFERDSSASWRISLWQQGLSELSHSPLVGVGLGRKIPLEMTNYRTFEEVRNIHNSPLAILVQIGVVGFVFFSGFVLSVLMLNWPNRYADLDLTPYWLGILSCIVTFLFCSLFQPYLETNLFGIMFWILLGLFRSQTVINNHENPSN